MIILDLIVASALLYFFSENLTMLIACLIATCCITFLRMSCRVDYWLKVLDSMIAIEFQDKEENK